VSPSAIAYPSMSILQSETLAAAGVSEYDSERVNAGNRPDNQRVTVDESWEAWYWTQEAGFSFDLNIEADNREQVQRNFLHYRELSLMKLRQRNIIGASILCVLWRQCVSACFVFVCIICCLAHVTRCLSARLFMGCHSFARLMMLAFL
jgi:hypothetical protein